MSGKFNNRTLLLVFLILTAILVVTRFSSGRKADQNLRTDLVQIDTSRVSSILLYPETEGGIPLEFKKSGFSWTVSKEGLTAAASRTALNHMLTEIMDMKTEQLVALSPDSWRQYQVEDSTGTRIQIREGKDVTLDLIVGRFHYQPPAQNSYQPYGQNRVNGKTYVRLSGEDEVYAVNGFLSMTLNQEFSRWRNQTITSTNPSQISRIVFDYPADSGFVAERSDAGWLVSGQLADSASMARYLRKSSRKSHGEFADGFQAPSQADFKLILEGDQMAPLQIKAFVQEDSTLVLSSSTNPGTWFTFDSKQEVEDLFPSYENLISGTN